MSRLRRNYETLSIGLIALIIYLAVAWQLAFQVEAYSIDAMARNNDARLILFAREPKLANIGFVWMPLPVVQQLPLVALPPLQVRGLAGSLATALMGAGLCALFTLILRQIGVPRLARWALVAAMGLNPMMVLYSANGMSEVSLAFFSVLMLWLYWRWHRDRSWLSLAGTGLAAMLACLVRYEAVVMVGVLFVFIAVETFFRHRPAWRTVESSLLVFGLPTLYALLAWLGAMGLIMGDPFYFARGDMSNAARVAYQIVDKPWLLPAKGHLLVAIGLAVQTVWAIGFPFIVLSGLVAVVALWRRNWFWLEAIVLAWSSLALTIYGLYQGVANFELRYMILAIPMGLLLAVGWLELVPRWRMVAGLLLAAAFAGAAWSASQAILTSVAHGDESPEYQGLLNGQTSPLLQPDIAMAQYIDAHVTGTVLLDENTSYSILFLSQHIERLVPRSDSLFGPALHDPAKYVNYILVRRPYLEPDAFQLTYPGFYDHGASWAQLVFDIGPWRLYRVVGGPLTPIANAPNLGRLMMPAQVVLILLFAALTVGLAANLIRRRQVAALAGVD